MQLVTVCRICGDNLTQTWTYGFEMARIHPSCDTRPPQQKAAPHPAEGQLRLAAHDATLALAAAQATPDRSPQWALFDEACQRVRDAQKAEQTLPLPVAAVAYATELAWPVFPLKPGEKTPLTPNGFKDATTDRAQVEQWWSQWPDANIGLPTGHLFSVVDIDTPVFETAWLDLVKEHDFEVHGLAATSSGGYHAYINEPEIDVKNRAGAFGPGIDFRTTGGYVVAPWSRRHDGQVWQWLSMPSNTIRGAA